MAMSVCRSVGRSVGLSVCRCDLAFQQHLVHVARLFSLVQSGLDQCRPIQSTLVKSSQIQKNLFQAISGSIQRMWRLFIVQTRLVKINLVYSSQIQTNLVKSRQIFSGLLLAAYITCRGSLQSSLDQWRPIKSTLVKSSQI